MTISAHTPKVLTGEEIDAMLSGDRRSIDKLMLTQVNSLSAAFLEFRYEDFPNHAKNEEKLNQELTSVVKELGNKEELRIRIAYIDAAILEANNRNKMWLDLRTELAKKTVWGLFVVLGALALYWWNGHMPTKP